MVDRPLSLEHHISLTSHLLSLKKKSLSFWYYFCEIFSLNLWFIPTFVFIKQCILQILLQFFFSFILYHCDSGAADFFTLFGMNFWLLSSNHLKYGFHVQYILRSWYRGTTYQGWKYKMFFFSLLTMIWISRWGESYYIFKIKFKKIENDTGIEIWAG